MFRAKPLVFLSYSRKDAEKVSELRGRLKSSGVRTWIDIHDIVGGEWRTAIKRGLRQSNFFLACLSRNTVDRGEILQYEHDSALEIQRDRLEGDIFLIPVRLEPCDLPEHLRHLHCFDVYEPAGWDGLKRALRTKIRRLPLAAAAGVTLVLAAVFVDAVILRPSAKEALLEARAQGRAAAVGKRVRVGLTLWKMQPSQESDPPSTREIVHPPAAGAPQVALTPVRPPSGARFQLGDTFQVTLEASRSGHLYVVSRRLAEDGSAGPASFVFPTLRIRGGDNQIWPGVLIRLPDRDADPPWWQFSSSRPDYAGEQLIVLLTPQPLPGFFATSTPLAVDDATLANWSKLYGKNVRSIVLDGPAQRLTPDEAAARDGGAQLPRSAPFPSVLFEADRGPGDPVLLTYPIPVGRPQ
jgi:hypothetical protein